MSSASVQLLGDVAITGPDGVRVVLRRQQPRTVAALLLSERHRSVSRSEIADVLWEDELPDHWAGAVRGVVSKVRAFLDEADAGDWLATTGEGWRLDVPDDASIDLEGCRSSVERAEESLRADDPDDPESSGRWTALTDELAVADRSLASELAPGARGSWVEDRREDAARWHRRALAALVECARRSARPDEATTAARTLVGRDPYSDQAARAEMLALVDAGDRSGALDAFDAFGRRLHDDLGVGPDAETEALARSIRGPAPPAPAGPGAWGGDPSPMVGRASQVGLLRREWQEVVDGSGARALLITGEPGAGKTRLATEAAGLVDRGCVLWGRCSPERRVSFEPVVEALARTLHRDRSPLDSLGNLAAELAPLLPELVDRPSPATVRRAEPSDRSQLFRAVTAAFRATIGSASVWVVDDVQWANDDTIALLAHLVGALADLDVLVVFTSRGHGPEVADMLSAAARSLLLTTVPLGGLDESDVVDLLTAAGVVDADVVGEIVLDRTGGNPFFIRELLRSTGPDGRLDPLAFPTTLRSWIDQRVAGLGESQAEALAAASVLGSEVDLEVLARMIGTDPLGALDRCRPLLADGLLAERNRSDDDTGLAFAHALTREAVNDGLGAIRARLLHQRAADAVRSVHADGAWSEVAGHLARAGSAVDAQAVPAMLAAADEALTQLAWVSARDWFQEAAVRRPDPGVERVQALIGLGTARRGLGDREGARAALAEALASADALGEHRLVTRATLALVGGGARGVSESMADHQRAELLRTAIAGLGSDDDDLVIQAQLELALALLLTDHDDERVRLADDALSRARRLGRDDLLGNALLGSRVAHHGPEHAEARLVEVDEVLALPPSSRSHAVTVGALMARHEDALLVGDRALARDALASAAAEVETSGHPYWRWVVRTWHVLGLIIDGDLDRAEALAFEAVQLQADHPESMACLGVNLVDVRLFQGRSGEVVDLLAAAADDNPQIPCYRAVLSLCLADADRTDEAEVQYRTFADASFRSVPDDTNRLLTLAVLADVATTVGDRRGAAELLGLLRPHAERQVLLNCFAGGGAYWGPVATQLARLSLLLGDDLAAQAWCKQARTSAEAFGAPLALARIPVITG